MASVDGHSSMKRLKVGAQCVLQWFWCLFGWFQGDFCWYVVTQLVNC